MSTDNEFLRISSLISKGQKKNIICTMDDVRGDFLGLKLLFTESYLNYLMISLLFKIYFIYTSSVFKKAKTCLDITQLNIRSHVIKHMIFMGPNRRA